MIKRTIKETVNEYDKDGNLVRQTITETSEDDDTQYVPYASALYASPEALQAWGEVIQRAPTPVVNQE